LFLPRGRPAKIMDFGVAWRAGATAATGIVGTPNYMSPEQVRGDSLDGRSDLFSAGLILYELVTGEKAYQGDSVVALVYKIAHEDADLSLLPRGEKWGRLRAVVTRALARDPQARYQDARGMQDELARALEDLGGEADWTSASDRGLLARGPLRPPAEPSTSVPPSTAVAAPDRRRQRTGARGGGGPHRPRERAAGEGTLRGGPRRSAGGAPARSRQRRSEDDRAGSGGGDGGGDAPAQRPLGARARGPRDGPGRGQGRPRRQRQRRAPARPLPRADAVDASQSQWILEYDSGSPRALSGSDRQGGSVR